MHSAMPGEPLVVLHTALTHGVARSMQQLLPAAAREARLLHVGGQHHTRLPPSDRTWEDQQHGAAAHVPGAAGAGHGEQHGADADAPTTAVFYSISATQQGLAGVDLGNFLIKQVGPPHPSCLTSTWQQPSRLHACRLVVPPREPSSLTLTAPSHPAGGALCAGRVSVGPHALHAVAPARQVCTEAPPPRNGTPSADDRVQPAVCPRRTCASNRSLLLQALPAGCACSWHE